MSLFIPPFFLQAILLTIYCNMAEKKRKYNKTETTELLLFDHIKNNQASFQQQLPLSLSNVSLFSKHVRSVRQQYNILRERACHSVLLNFEPILRLVSRPEDRRSIVRGIAVLLQGETRFTAIEVPELRKRSEERAVERSWGFGRALCLQSQNVKANVTCRMAGSGRNHQQHDHTFGGIRTRN